MFKDVEDNVRFLKVCLNWDYIASDVRLMEDLLGPPIFCLKGFGGCSF